MVTDGVVNGCDGRFAVVIVWCLMVALFLEFCSSFSLFFWFTDVNIVCLRWGILFWFCVDFLVWFGLQRFMEILLGGSVCILCL